MNRSLRVGGAVAIAALIATAGCNSGKQDTSAPPKADSSTLPSSPSPTQSSGAPGTSAASPSGSGSAPDSASASAPTSSPPAPVRTTAVPGLSNPCSLLSNDTIDSALGVTSATGKSNSGPQFVGCSYALAGSGATGTLTLNVSTGRGDQIYGAVDSGGGFNDVSGVGTQAAYNSEDGRFIARTDKDFVELTLPFGMKGSTSASPDGAKKAGATLAKKVLSEVG